MTIRNIAAGMLGGALVSFVFACFALAYPTIFPTGTTIYKPGESYGSYILVSDHSSLGNHPDAKVRTQDRITDDVRLIDMNGRVVHTWKVAPNFNKRSRLLPNGHLVYAGPDKTIYEYDWDGKVVWKHEGIGSINDLRVLPNGNKLLVAHEPIPQSRPFGEGHLHDVLVSLACADQSVV